MSRLLTLALFSIMLGATCRKNNTDVTVDPTGGVGQTDGSEGADGRNGSGGMDATPDRDTPEHVATIVANFSRVYFDFDSSELAPEAKAALDANVALLQKYPDIKVQIQGHADERGTTEYNMALGDRRANEVKTYLANQGVAPSRLTLISYGEEMPLDASGGERAWSVNRRAEFIVTWGGDGQIGSSTGE